MKNESQNIKSRKIAKSREYKLPELNEEELLLDNEDIEYEQDKTQYWLESFNNKSQYDITENLCAQTW